MKIASFQFESLDGSEEALRRAPVIVAPKTVKNPIVSAPPEPPPPPPPPPITALDVERVRRESFIQGMTQGAGEERKRIAEEGRALEEVKLKVLQSIVSGENALHKEYIDHLEQTSANISDLILAIAKKVIGRELRYTALPVLRHTVQDCLQRLTQEPRIMVYVHPELMHDMETEMKSLAAMEDYHGTLGVEADDRMEIEDCRIEWKNGRVERNVSQVMKQIDALLKQYGDTLRSKIAVETYDRLKDTLE